MIDGNVLWILIIEEFSLRLRVGVTSYEFCCSVCPVFWLIQIHNYKESFLKVAFTTAIAVAKPIAFQQNGWYKNEVRTMIHYMISKRNNFKQQRKNVYYTTLNNLTSINENDLTLCPTSRLKT